MLKTLMIPKKMKKVEIELCLPALVDEYTLFGSVVTVAVK